jgi:virulence-associated protein VagC
MATNVAIDRELLERALAVSGERTRKAVVTRALQEFIARREQRRIAELLGKLEWDDSYDYKAERSRRGSQAVHLPAEFRIDADQVYVWRDERTGDVVLSTRPRKSRRECVALRQQLGPLRAGERMKRREQSSEQRDPFAGCSNDAANALRVDAASAAQRGNAC